MTAHPPPEREPTTRGNPHERKLAALRDRLDTEIRALRTGEDWARWLRAAARMPGQDFAAVLLIAAQRPGATMVAGYEAWQAAGRQVGKGERGIQILAPGPRLSYVWDISQTTGTPPPAGPAERLPSGQVPPGAWDALVALAASHGFSAGCGDCGGGAGATTWADRRIRVHPGLGPADAVRALAHEVAHVLLHGPAAYPPPASTARCRGVRKVEADSVAFVVCASLGLDVSGIVFPQVASWAGDDERARPAATVRGNCRPDLNGCAHCHPPSDRRPACPRTRRGTCRPAHGGGADRAAPCRQSTADRRHPAQRTRRGRPGAAGCPAR